MQTVQNGSVRTQIVLVATPVLQEQILFKHRVLVQDHLELRYRVNISCCKERTRYFTIGIRVILSHSTAGPHRTLGTESLASKEDTLSIVLEFEESIETSFLSAGEVVNAPVLKNGTPP